MKLKLPIVYLVIMCSISFSESVNLLPLESLEINMSVEELKGRYPDAKWGMVKEDDTGAIEQAIVAQQIIDNRFWSSGLVIVESGKVDSCTYIGKSENIDIDVLKPVVTDIYQQLVQKFGREPEKKVANSDIPELAQLNQKMPVYVWNEDGLIYAFTHKSFSEHHDGEKFSYTLRIMEQKTLPSHLINLYDYQMNEEHLFTDLSGKIDGEKGTAGYGLIVVGLVTAMAVLSVVILIFKNPKRETKKKS